MTPLVGVHGFAYDPADDPPTALYAQWSMIFGRKVIPFLYNSKPSFFGSLFKWESPYHQAWVEADDIHAQRLADLFDDLVSQGHDRIDVCCHSLGTRTFLAAYDACEGLGIQSNIDRALLLNGADSCEHAIRCMPGKYKGTQFFNVMSKDDAILTCLGGKFILAAWDAPGTPREQRRLAKQERKDIQAGKRGWPKLIGRHGLPQPVAGWTDHLISSGHWSYRSAANWPMMKAFLA